MLEKLLIHSSVALLAPDESSALLPKLIDAFPLPAKQLKNTFTHIVLPLPFSSAYASPKAL